MMWRSLTVPDPERKSEIILFYVEAVASEGLTLADLYKDDQETEVWLSIQADLRQRASTSILLTTLDDEGRPEPAGWASIP